MVQRTETQTIHRSDRASAHGEDVAQNTSDSCGCTLKRFDERWMVVRFDFKRGTPTIAEVNDSGIFARRNNHAFTSCRQSLQMNARRFVRAVLRPHDREDAKLIETWFSTEKVFYSL